MLNADDLVVLQTGVRRRGAGRCILPHAGFWMNDTCQSIHIGDEQFYDGMNAFVYGITSD